MAYPQGPAAAAPRKPSKTGIIWAIVIFAVTAVIGIAMIVASFVTLGSAIGDLSRVDAGDTARVTLGSGDQYVIASADSKSDLNRVRVTITDSDGNPVRLRSGTSFDTSSSGSASESLGYIDVTGGPETYTVSVDGPPGAEVRIGEIPLGRFLALLLGGIAIGAIGFVVALVVLIVALVRRSRVKKENRGGVPPAGYGAGPGGYGQVPGYGQPGAPPGYGQPPATPAPGYGQPTPSSPPPPAPPAATPPPPAPPGPSTPPPPAPPGQGTPPPPPPPGPANPT